MTANAQRQSRASEQDLLKREETNRASDKQTFNNTTTGDGLACENRSTKTKTACDIVSIVPRNSPEFPDVSRFYTEYLFRYSLIIEAPKLVSIIITPKTGRYAFQVVWCVETDKVVR